MSKNISNKELDKEIKKWLESFSREEWLEKLDRQKYLYEFRKWLEFKESNTGIFSFEYEGLKIKDKGKFVWTKDKYMSLKKDKFSGSDLNIFKEIFKEIPEAA
ncbi:unnamed protein product [marine sediment metagenome]|uniref:Uncharacterized protein n=1 Tax=marine sediment metagenome TaxID=412755 RepID=X1LMJ0_9ZZZZ